MVPLGRLSVGIPGVRRLGDLMLTLPLELSSSRCRCVAPCLVWTTPGAGAVGNVGDVSFGAPLGGASAFDHCSFRTCS